MLVLSGGVSAGRYDHVPSVLAEIGVRRVFHQVSQRPGRPLWFGVDARGVMVFALPGNPVSVLVCLARYVIPALAAACGARALIRQQVALARAFEFRAPLTCFLPVSLEYDPESNRVGARTTIQDKIELEVEAEPGARTSANQPSVPQGQETIPLKAYKIGAAYRLSEGTSISIEREKEWLDRKPETNNHLQGPHAQDASESIYLKVKTQF